ncbi:MAG: ParB/RepB/Spo0J family partition protein, partial [Anaerolineae bacterium]|nr:ParB/RepB/Spo0J family partition protein [Anaerolineae bacterium]
MVDEKIVSLAVTDIERSATNPRTVFDEKELAELGESLKQGQIDPIRVRSMVPGSGKGAYVIIEGERRWRAADKAGITHLKAIVVDITPEKAAEEQLLAFIHSKGIDPLDEAEAYHKVIALHAKAMPKLKDSEAQQEVGKAIIAELAQRFGKERSYVVKILKLTHLIDTGKEMLRDRRIDLEGAMAIARMAKDFQKYICDHLMEELSYKRFISAKEIQKMVARELLDLHRAPFDPKDAVLVKSAGSCLLCPKMTGNAPDLFGDIKSKQTCTDHACFASKVDAHISHTIETYKSEGKEIQPITNSYSDDKRLNAIGTEHYEVVPLKQAKKFGIYVDDREGRGQVVGIRLRSEEKVVEKSNSKKSSKPAPTFERRMELYKRREEIWNNKVEQQVREELYAHCLMRLRWPIDMVEFRLILMKVVERITSNPNEELVKRLVTLTGIKLPKADWDWGEKVNQMIPKFADQQCVQLLFGIFLTEELIADPTLPLPNDMQFKTLLSTPRYKNIDRKKITEVAQDVLAPKKPKKPVKEEKQEKSKVKKDNKPRKGVCRICGCTAPTPCMLPGYGPCSWV